MGWFGWRDSDTCGVLVAGRKYDFSDFKKGQVVELCEAIDAIAERAGLPIVTVPADIDLTDEIASDDDPAYCSAFIGVMAADGGTDEPLEVKRDAMLGAVAKAKAIPAAVWGEITAAYREAGGKQESDDDIVLRLGCTGCLPMAMFAFGVLGEKDAGIEGDFVRGQSPGQEPHEVGVYGVELASCSYDGSGADPIDLGDEAHAARAAKVPNGAYYLIARYD